MNTHLLKEGEDAAKKGIFRLLGLGCIKLLVGLFTGLTVVIADSISTFADALSLGAAYTGLHLSRKNADRKFQYGYYKVETFSAFLISIGIIIVSLFLFKESLDLFLNTNQAHNRPFAITAAIFAIFQSRRMANFLEKAGKKVNSLSLLANARDKKNDVLIQIGILAAIYANYNSIPYVEGMISTLISLIVLKDGLLTAKDSVFYLLDYWDDPKLRRKIAKQLNKEKEIVKKVEKIRLRRAGTFIFGEAFIEINPFIDMLDLKETLKILEKNTLKQNPYIKDFSIYSHIPDVNYMKVAVPLKSGTGLNAIIANTIKETNSYLFAEIKNNKIKNFYTKKIKNAEKDPVRLANFLKKEKITTLINNKINSLTYYNLKRANQILIYPNFNDVSMAGSCLKLLLLDT